MRTPRGKGKAGGSLYSVRPVALGSLVLKEVVGRNQLDSSQIEDVVFGCVTAVGEQGGNLAKSAAMEAELHEKVCGVTVNRFCGSGLEAVNQAAARIASGQEKLLIAGGVESMSHVPMMSDGGAWPTDPILAQKTGFVPQGISADLIASLRGYTREQLDEFALNSHLRASEAWKEKRFNNSIVKVQDLNGEVLLESDEMIRADANKNALSDLKPSFLQMGKEGGFDSVALQKYPELETIEHFHSPGNSSGIVDGSAAVLIGDKSFGEALGLKPRAKIRSYAVEATDPTIMLVGPAPATRKALKLAGLSIEEIDLFEVNEAFASVVLNFMEEMNVSHEKVNVNGGAIAMGHPLGATGAIILGTLLDELERRDQKLGVATLCIGGGMGIATVIERV